MSNGVLTGINLLWAMVFPSSSYTESFVGDCYEGGSENGPGQVVFILLPITLVVALIIIVPLLDWLVRGASRLWRFLHKNRQGTARPKHSS
jgi:hypothetical protein